MKALLVVALTVGAPPADRPPASNPAVDALHTYMAALEEVVARRRRIVELVVAGRDAEAAELLKAPRPPILGSDMDTRGLSVPDGRGGTGGGPMAERAWFARQLGFPELAPRGDGGGERDRTRRALELWATRPPEPDALFYDRLIESLPLLGRVLALEAAAARPGASVEEKVARLRQAAEESRGDRALEAWQRLAEARLTPFVTAKALLMWGTHELARGRAAAAIPLLEQARDLDPDLRASSAQWALGHAHLAMGNPAAALAAWKRDEAEFLVEPCARRDAERMHRIWQGLALERLGRVEEALSHYASVLGHPGVAAHVLDLYETAGQFEDAERMFAELKFRYPVEYADAVPGLSMLVLRRMARAGDWASLGAAAASFADPGFLEDDAVLPSSRGQRAIAKEARRLLARASRGGKAPFDVARAREPWQEPLPEFPPAVGRALPPRVTPQAPRAARHDLQRRHRLLERPEMGIGCAEN